MLPMKRFFTSTLLVFLLLTLANCFCQNTNTTPSVQRIVRIEMTDGKQYTGKFLAEVDGVISLETANGLVYLDKRTMKMMVTVDEAEVGPGQTYNPLDVSACRNVFSPNALPQRKKQSYVLIHLYGPELYLNFGKGFSCQLMTTWPLILGSVGLRKTFKTPLPKLNFSVQSAVMNSGVLNLFQGWYGCHTASVTFGSERKNISLKGGYLWYEAGFKGAQHLNAEPGDYATDSVSYSSLFSPRGDFYKSSVYGISGNLRKNKTTWLFELAGAVRKRSDKTIQLVEIAGDDYYRIQEEMVLTTHVYFAPGFRTALRNGKSLQISVPVFAFISTTSRWIIPTANFTFFIPLESGIKFEN